MDLPEYGWDYRLFYEQLITRLETENTNLHCKMSELSKAYEENSQHKCEIIRNQAVQIEEQKKKIAELETSNTKMALDNLSLRAKLAASCFPVLSLHIPCGCCETDEGFTGKAVYIGEDKDGLVRGKIYQFKDGQTTIKRYNCLPFSSMQEVECYYPGCPGMRFDEQAMKSGESTDWVVVKED